MKVLSIFGTRPEAIKMAPVIHAVQAQSAIISRVCVTAQHRQMLDQVLELFDLQPDHDLDLMQANQTLAGFTAKALTALDQVIAAEQPDWVLVQGDTTTAMTGALAAYYRQVKVVHVEAGLRTDNKWQPFPEEINRQIVDNISDLHCAPTELARQNLLRAGCREASIIVTGNTVIDALFDVAERPFSWESSVLACLPRTARLILITAHRRENFGAPLRDICRAIRTLTERYPAAHFVFPVHFNPNVRTVTQEELRDIRNLTMIEPLEYLPLVHLLKQCELVLTDSGGLQEEAPSLGKPVLVMRETTERPEGIAAGTVKLVGTNTNRIIQAVSQLLDDPVAYAQMAQAVNPYGDGRASGRIVKRLLADDHIHKR